MASRDDLYSKDHHAPGGFAFDSSVASVFEDMIKRSVPGYAMTLSLMELIANRHARSGTRIYDLGCSLGAGLIAMGKHIATDDIQLIGVDTSEPMLQRCRQHTDTELPTRQVELLQQDILETPIENASIVVLNFTLQFIPKEKRTALLARISEGIAPGGVLLLSEKIQFEEARIQKELTDLHHDFKRANGYSELEIARKRDAIENVLIPETTNVHKQRLKAAGFTHCETWLQCFNFASFIALR
ncbi:MAG: carboxy-S-adenosyl-L-methionine synthase CmoA [Verrucomicrobiota bacterium]